MFFETTIVIGIVFLVAVAIYLLYSWIRNKRQGSLVRVLLFEQVGNDKVYRGVIDSKEVTDDKLGNYITLKGIKKGISVVDQEDYFPDYKYGKCLMVCKFADDDYRVMSRMQNDKYFKRTEREPYEYLETQEVTDETTGEVDYEFVRDDKGKLVFQTDEDGEALSMYKLEPYTEPIGVSQSAREAQRFNRDFTRRMQEKRKEASGFWDKYGQFVMGATFAIVLLLAVAYNTNKTTEAMTYMADKYAEKSDEIIQAAKNPGFAQSLLDKLEERQVPQDEPPPE